MNKITIVIALILSSTGLFAQEKETLSQKTEISIEIDPSTFGFHGYGFHLRIKPKNSDHLLLGIGAYAMDFPDLLVDLNSENKDEGWKVRLNQGYGLFGEYHFSEVNKKWFVGSQIAIQEYEIEKDFFDGKSSHTNILVMGTGGYTLQPFEAPVYFKFWGGLGYTDKISGDDFIGNAEYDIAPILFFGALHIGYTFNNN